MFLKPITFLYCVSTNYANDKTQMLQSYWYTSLLFSFQCISTCANVAFQVFYVRTSYTEEKGHGFFQEKSKKIFFNLHNQIPTFTLVHILP